MPRSPVALKPRRAPLAGGAKEPVPGWLRAGLALTGLVLTAAVVAFAVLAQRALQQKEAGRWVGRRLPAFELTDQLGRPFGSEALAGGPAVVSFVFTGCSLTCRQVASRMEEIQRGVAGWSGVRLVSFTVDPRSDTPEALKDFGGLFHADSERWSLVTGSPAEVERVVAGLLDRVPPGARSEMPGGFLGTERILVLDAGGRVRAAFDGLKPATPAAVLEALAALNPAR